MMLAKRILLMFFSNRVYVAGALWSMAITVVLFVAFLGEQTANTMYFFLGERVDAPAVIVGTVFGGLVAVISVNVTLGALQIIVEDWRGAAKDFHVSPVSHRHIGLGYILGTIAVGVFMVLCVLLICIGYLAFLGAGLPTPNEMGLLLLTTILAVTASTTFVYFIILIIKNPNTFAAFAGALHTLIRFMMGVYVPIVVLPDPIQWFVRLFPLTHSAAMFRELLAGMQLDLVFEGASPESVANFRNTFALSFDYGAFTSDFWFSAMYLAISTIVFYILGVIISRRKTTHF